MKTTFLTLLFIAGTQLCAFAQMSGGFQNSNFGESVAIGGKFYHKVQLVSVIDGTAQLKTQEGDVKVPWASLPADFQKKHAGEIEALNKKVEEQKAREQDAKIGAKEFTFRINVSGKNGALGSTWRGSTNLVTLYVEGQGFDAYPNDTELKIKAYPNGLYVHNSLKAEKWVLISVSK